MAQKNIKALPAIQLENWIKTPYSYSRIGANLTLRQQDILLRVSNELQGHIKKFYDDSRNLSKERPNGLFDAETLLNLPPIEMQMADLCANTRNYDEIKNAIDEIKKLSVWFYDARRHYYEDYSVFGRITRPVIPSTSKMSDEEKKKLPSIEGTIKFYINPLMAKFVFDMSQGYVSHLKTIAIDSKKRSTPRVYLMLTRYSNQGRMEIDIPYEDLKEYLGMYERDERGIIVSEQYPEYARFKRWVIETAKADLERMSKLNQSDITFTYEPVYKGTRKRGNPDKVHFNIISTPLGKAHAHMMHADAAIKKLMAYVVKMVPGIDTAQAEGVMKHVPYPYFDEYQRQAYKTIQAAVVRTDINDLPTYILAALHKLLPQEFAQAQAKQQQAAASATATARPKGKGKARQLDLFGSLTPFERWTRCIQMLCRAVDADTAKATFEQLHFDSYDENTHQLVIKTKREVVELVENEYIGLFGKALFKCFGDKVIPKYRPMN